MTKPPMLWPKLAKQALKSSLGYTPITGCRPPGRHSPADRKEPHSRTRPHIGNAQGPSETVSTFVRFTVDRMGWPT